MQQNKTAPRQRIERRYCRRCGEKLADTTISTCVLVALSGITEKMKKVVPGERLYCSSCWQEDGDRLTREMMDHITPLEKQRLRAAMQGDGFRFWQRNVWRRFLAGVVEDQEERDAALKRRAIRGRPKAGPVWATDKEARRLFIPPCLECGGPPHPRTCRTGARGRKRQSRSRAVQ
jgi:hypothetical protein